MNTPNYNLSNDIIRTASQLSELEEQKMEQLRKELELGEESEMIENFDPEKHLQDLHDRLIL